MATTSATEIEAVLDESGPDYEDFTYEPASSGHRADVYMVNLTYRGEDYEVVVKFKPSGDDRFAVEPRLHEYVANRTTVPVPRILVFKEEPTRNVPPYFVTERVQGSNLADQFGDISRETWGDVVEQVGSILGTLHEEIGFEAFGPLVLHDGRLNLGEWRSDWREYFGELTRRHIDRLADSPFDDFVDQAHDGFEAALPAVPTGGVPRLVHDDLQPANLLYSSDGSEPITAVLDWQDTLAAHPEYHMAQAEFLYIDSTFNDPDLQAHLRDRLYGGYRSHRPFEADEDYRRARPVYQLSTLLWRMTGFEDAYRDEEGLGKARAEWQHRQQFERLVNELPRLQ